MAISGGKRTTSKVRNREKKNIICQSEKKKLTLLEKTSVYFPPAPSSCYYADKNIKHCYNKTNF